MRDDIARTLNAAADVLERDGWARGTAHNPAGGHCVLGALALVTGYHVKAFHIEGKLPHIISCEEREPVMAEAAREFSEFIGSGPHPANIPMWNDAEHRTPEEVVKTLRAAAGEAA